MHRFGDILYVAGSGGAATPGLRRAAALARSNGGRLTIARVLELAPEDWLRDLVVEGPELVALIEAEHEVELSWLAEEAAALGVRARTRLLRGKPFLAVIREALVEGHDLVMKEAEGVGHRRGTGRAGGLRRRLFGSTDQHLMRKCPCPVWLFDRTREDRFRSVLAAVDVAGAERQELNRRVVQLASSLAAREGAALHVVHAWSLYGESILRSRARGITRERLHELVVATKRERRKRLRDLVRAEAVAGSEPVLHLVKAPAPLGIRHVARRVEADVVVMGTLSRAGAAGLLIGNTAETVLSQLECGVLTVKPLGFRSPVILEEGEVRWSGQPAVPAGG